MKSWKRTTVSFTCLLLAGLLLGGCEKAPEAPPPPPPPEVDVLTVTTQPFEMTMELPGRTSAFRVAEVRPQVSGIIQKRLFVEGAEVKAGDLLYQIDPATYKAQVDSAEAALDKALAVEHSARLKADRYKALIRTAAVSEQDQVEMVANWKQATAEVSYAKAALATAKISLAYTRVTAPISGRIGKSMVTEGALVTAQQPSPLVVIQQLDPLYVDVNQASMGLISLKKEISAIQGKQDAQPKPAVMVLLENGDQYEHTGVLEFSDVTVNQSTGTVVVRAIVDNPDEELLPGMFVRARIFKGIDPAAILIPSGCIIRNARGQATVKLVNKENIVEMVIIEAGQAVGEQTIVRKGLKVGDRVIVNGLQKAAPDAPVKPVEWHPAPAAAATPPPQATPTKAE